MTLAARAASVLVVAIALVCTGCDELSARRLIQKGNEDYAEQRYEAAAAKFEAALAKSPDLDIGLAADLGHQMHLRNQAGNQVDRIGAGQGHRQRGNAAGDAPRPGCAG